MDVEAQEDAAKILCALSYGGGLEHRIAAVALPALACLIQGCTTALGRGSAIYAVFNLIAEPALFQKVADAVLPQLCHALNVGG